ncbi:PNGase F N-terminal domain-containing protein [Tenacibaculum xiamenense]|uniref:PNGase F N-terminal domain-containing protein n=1 Tax=Tenacibaculum xiamenense TaxID=1261553 RepID=UPI003895D237
MKRKITLVIVLFLIAKITAQRTPVNVNVFKNNLINFNGDKSQDIEEKRLQSGRLIYKKVAIPHFKKGTDVTLKLTVRSNGDRWDKSGSCFVITNPDNIHILNVSEGKSKFPKKSYFGKEHGGVKLTETYTPALELLRFMTPFGVGHYSNDKGKHRKPVYIPVWEKEVVWKQDISHLLNALQKEVYIGVWIDTWTKEGYSCDLELNFSNRPLKTPEILPLVNSVYYVKGQSLPDNFAKEELSIEFDLPHNSKNVKLYYTTTGHGGHSGGDEFIKIKNSVYFNRKMVLDTIPWRDDCASFRRFNPTSGVWLKKDSASYIDFKAKAYKVKEIEERIASSDLSRSNWCPGSSVAPYVINLGMVEKGKHTIKIVIPATEANGDKLNHWLVSAYLTYNKN